MSETEKAAHAMMNPDSRERKEAEKMMGCRFEEMTKPQRVLAAQMLAAFMPFIPKGGN